jgi:hypothetical protein
MATKKNTVAETTEQQYVTAYQIHKMLRERGVERKPQMVYNYLRNNLIPGVDVNGQRLVKIEDAVAWIEKFSTKVLSK